MCLYWKDHVYFQYFFLWLGNENEVCTIRTFKNPVLAPRFSEKEITTLGKKNHLRFISKEYVQSCLIEQSWRLLEFQRVLVWWDPIKPIPSKWKDWTFSLKINCRWFFLPSLVISFWLNIGEKIITLFQPSFIFQNVLVLEWVTDRKQPV